MKKIVSAIIISLALFTTSACGGSPTIMQENSLPRKNYPVTQGNPCYSEGALACSSMPTGQSAGLVCQDGKWIAVIQCGDFRPSYCTSVCPSGFALCCTTPAF